MGEVSGISVCPTVEKTTKKSLFLSIRLPFVWKFGKVTSKSDLDKQGGDNSRSRHVVSQMTDSQAANIQAYHEMRAASHQEHPYLLFRKQGQPDNDATERITLSQEGNLSLPYTSSATFRIARRPVPLSSPIWQQNTGDIGGLLGVGSDIPAMPTILPPPRSCPVSEDRTTPLGSARPPIRTASTIPQPMVTLAGLSTIQQPPPLPPRATHLQTSGSLAAKPGTQIAEPQSTPKIQSAPPPPSGRNNAARPHVINRISLPEDTISTPFTSTEPRFPTVPTRKLSTHPNHLPADISLTVTSVGSTQQVNAIKAEDEEFKKEGTSTVKPEKLSTFHMIEQETELSGQKLAELIDHTERLKRDQTLKRKQERAEAAEIERRAEEREKQADLEGKRKERELLRVLETERTKEFQRWARKQERWERQVRERQEKLAEEKEKQLEREEKKRQIQQEKVRRELQEKQKKWIREQQKLERQAEIQRVRLERERLVAALEEARVNKEKQEALERQRRDQAGQEREQQRKRALGSVGAHIEVRRINGWQYQTGTDVSQLTPAILKQLKTVKDNFNVPGCNIIKIEYIMNDALYKQFNDTKAKFRRLPGRSTKEEILFHGTSPENVDRYCLD